jgi:hypothetical protein
LLTTGLLMGGACAGIAIADRGDSAGPSPDAASLHSKADSGSGGSNGATGAANPDPPTSTVGNGRENVDVTSTNEEKKKIDNPVGPKKFNGSVTILVLRLPKKDELPASGWPAPTLFYTTVVIPVPTLSDVFAAMQPQPEPTPTPGPAFRTQEEAPAVADSGGGGVDPLSTGVAAEPPVLHAPMVIAPLPIPPVVVPVAPLGASEGAGPSPAVAVDTAAAGARAPLIRGSLPPTAVEAPAGALTPMSRQATRLGYPRYLRSPTIGELAAIALPGAAGLLFLTFSGGFIGYRQANSVRFIRTHGADRFLR